MLPSWENHRRWTAGEYFPIFDQQQAKGVLTRFATTAFVPSCFFSGLFYTFQNKRGETAAICRAGNVTPIRWCSMRRVSPQPMCSTNHRPTKQTSGNGIPISFAPPHRAPKICSLGDRSTSRLGHRHRSDGPGDQRNGRRLLQHRARPSAGRGPVPVRDLPRPFWPTWASMAAHSAREFLQMNEELHEELIPYLGGFHTREHKEYWWYRGAARRTRYSTLHVPLSRVCHRLRRRRPVFAQATRQCHRPEYGGQPGNRQDASRFGLVV